MEVLGKKFEFWSELGINSAYPKGTKYNTVGIKYCTWEYSNFSMAYGILGRRRNKNRTIYCTIATL